MAVHGRNLFLRECAVGIHDLVHFGLGAVEHFQKVSVPTGDIHIPVQLLDQLFDDINIRKTMYEGLLYGDPKLRILRILWTNIYNDHNAAIKEAQNGKH